MPKIDDCGYKKLFSNKTIFSQLIETFVNEDWVKDLDFGHCETLDKSFVSEHYKQTESDIIYKVKLKGKEVYFYILMEFQSRVDYFMALRVLNYITNFYMDYISSNKRIKKLPPVFPIVLYNGEARWTAPVNLSGLIDANELLGRFSLNFEYFKISENEYSKEALLKIRNIVSTLFLAESYYDVELLQEELLSLFDREADKQALSLFLNWFKQLSAHERIDAEDYDSFKKVYNKKEEVKSMLITALRKEKQEIFEKGKLEGMLEGKQKWKLEGKLEVARALLSREMEVSQISKLTGILEEDILKLKSTLN